MILCLACSCVREPLREMSVRWKDAPRPQGAAPTEEPALLLTEDEPRNVIRLSGARGETLSFQLRLDDIPPEADTVDMSASPLSGPEGELDPDCMTFFRAHPVRVASWPGWHLKYVPPDRRVRDPYDVLVPIGAPRGGLTRLCQAERPIQIWIDLAIPTTASPGRYEGRLMVQAAMCRPFEIPLQLDVWPFVLAPADDVGLLAWVDVEALKAEGWIGESSLPPHVSENRSSRYAALGGASYAPSTVEPIQETRPETLLLECARQLSLHGVTPLVRGIYPKARMDAQRRLIVDWSAYDRVIGLLIENLYHSPNAIWALPADDAFPPRGDDVPLNSTVYLEVWKQYLAQCAAHFEALGLLNRTFVSLPSADPATVIQLGGYCRRADDRLSVAAALAPLRETSVDGIASVDSEPPPAGSSHAVRPIDIWNPPARFYDPRIMRAEREQGRRTWMTLDRPPFSGTLSPAGSETDRRAIAWQARRLGAEWVDLGPVGTWAVAPKTANAERNPDVAANDSPPLLYSGAPYGLSGPVPSARLKELRRGLQDVAYLRLLRERGLDHVAETLLISLVPFVGSDARNTSCDDGHRPSWPRDPRIWEAARRIMADELLRHDGQNDILPSDIRWRRFMQATRVLNVQSEGVRLSLMRDGGVSLQAATVVTNQKRLPVVADLRFDVLPIGWKTDPVLRRIGPLSAGQRQRMTLTARLVEVPTLTDGITAVPLSLTGEDGWSTAAKARVACVTALPTVNPIRLDGALDEWPVAAGHVAGDFRLVSADPAVVDPAAYRPRHATTAYLVSDALNLYLAVKCRANPADRPVVCSNTLRYDDGIPRGDDLIEVLFDPVRDGSRSPDRLLHLVMMRSGAIRTERGVEFNGEASPQPWPIAFQWAMTEQADGWSVEMSIPWTAFGDALPRPAIWGFNVTRWEPQEQEFSSWSGASPNVYDPISLGNLYVP